MLEKAPESEYGGNARYSGTGFRFVHAGGDEIRKFLPDVDEASEDAVDPTVLDILRDPALIVDGVDVALSAIGSSLKELDQAERDHLAETDTDARMMKMKRGFEFAYNAQAVADDQSGLVVGAEVVNAENDYHLLIPMLDQVKENLGKVAEQTAADGGYATGPELAQAEANEYGVLVKVATVEGDGEFDQTRFSYDQSQDHCVCPRGEVLKYESRKKDRAGEEVRVYRCGSYEQCPVRWQCSQNKRGRTVAITAHYAVWNQQREKQKNPEMAALLKKRSQVIERIFGWIKQNLGFRRWTAFGLENVQAQWSLLCLTLNLRTLYRYWAVGKLNFTRAMA